MYLIHISFSENCNAYYKSISLSLISVTVETLDMEYEKENGLPLTISQSMLLKNGWLTMSRNPVSRWQPNLSAGFLFRKPLSTDAAFTDNERGNRMVFSRITANRDTELCFMTKMSEVSYVHQTCYIHKS